MAIASPWANPPIAPFSAPHFRRWSILAPPEAVAPPTRQRGWRCQGGVPLARVQGRGAPGRGPGAAPPAPGQRPSRRICGSYRIPAPPGSPSLRLLVPRSPGSPPIGSEKRAGAAARPRTRDSGGVEPMGAVTWAEPPAAAHAVEPTSRTPQEPGALQKTPRKKGEARRARCKTPPQKKTRQGTPKGYPNLVFSLKIEV